MQGRRAGQVLVCSNYHWLTDGHSGVDVDHAREVQAAPQTSAQRSVGCNLRLLLNFAASAAVFRLRHVIE